jgi:hypothetical protein
LVGYNVGITNGTVLRSTPLKRASGGMIYIPSFVMIHSGTKLILMSLAQQIIGCSAGRIYEVRRWNASGGMVHIPTFIKIGICSQAILRFCLNNLRGCNVGITDGMDS